MENISQTKFWLIEQLKSALEQAGVSIAISDLITFIVACTIIALLVWLFDFLGTKVLIEVVHNAVKRTETMWDDYLLKRKFFNRLIRFIAAWLVLVSAKIIFMGYDRTIIVATEVIIQIIMVVLGILIISAFFDAANDVYETKPQAKQKSIKGFIQTAKIIIYCIGGVLCISILFRKDPSDLLVGIGASAAIFTLVFKDTILGFVASIQISAQDMIRPGDWIEMPSKNADGVVTEINVNSVKVRNWNNTITMVPIYSLVSESFTNWRNMQESDGRRFKRPLDIDINSIDVLCPEKIANICANPYISPLAEQMVEIANNYNTNGFLTNLGLYRSYIETLLLRHPYVDNNQSLVVKYMPITENGIQIEIYGFSLEKDLMPYERVVSDIFDNLIIAAPIFGIKLYQRPLSSKSETTSKS